MNATTNSLRFQVNKIEMVIANANKRFALILSMMKDLGTRQIELTWLKLKDIDLETGIVNTTTAKFGVGRTLKLKAQTLAILKTYVNKKKLGLNDRLFPVKSNAISEAYRNSEIDWLKNWKTQLSKAIGYMTFDTLEPQWNIIEPKICCTSNVS
jgi:integrase